MAYIYEPSTTVIALHRNITKLRHDGFAGLGVERHRFETVRVGIEKGGGKESIVGVGWQSLWKTPWLTQGQNHRETSGHGAQPCRARAAGRTRHTAGIVVSTTD